MISRFYHGHFHFSKTGEIGRLLWAHVFSQIGSALVTIFVPIFLLNTGFSLFDVFLYLSMQGMFSVPLQFVAAWLVSLAGANRMMTVGIVLHIGFFVLLITLPQYHWPLALLALAWAAHRSTYWCAFHANFSKARIHTKTGRQISLVQVIKMLAAGLAPAVGGVIASRFGINWSYGAALGLQAISLVPLVSASEITVLRPPKFRSLHLRAISPDLVASAGYSITTMAETIVWPIFVFTLISSYAGVGILSSVIAVASILAVLYVGRREAVRGERHYLKQGLTLAGVSDALRLLAANALHVLGINFLGGIGNALYSTPYLTRYYQHADEEPRVEYISAMEMAHEIAWAFYFLLLAGLTLILPPEVVLLFGIALAIPGNYITLLIR